MITKKIELDNYNLHLIKLETFKSVTIDFKFKYFYEKESLPALNFLSEILTFTNKKYNKRNDFVNEQMDLYDLELNSSFYTKGKNSFIDVSARMLNEKYTEKNMFNKVLEFMSEVIYKPNIDNNKFDSESFGIIKRDMQSELDTIKENPSKYALIKYYEVLNYDTDFISVLSEEYLNLFNNITEENLVDTYNKFINNFNVDIMIIGDIDFDEVTESIKKYFKFSKRNEVSIEPKKYSRVNKTNEVINKEKSLQAKLILGYTIDELTSKEKEYVMPIFNLILGGYANSRFFKIIREKYSLCYGIHSSIRESDNLLLIRSGITKSNYSKIMTHIKKEINNIKTITDADLNDAVMTYKMAVNASLESPIDIINNYYTHICYNYDLLENKLLEIDKVSIEEVKDIINKIHISTIYLYGGDSK